MRTRRGFTLVELLIAMVMTGVVVGALYQVLLTQQRVARQQAEQVDLNANVRAVVGLLPTELRELNAADTVESDLVGIGSTALTYKAMRGAYVLCQDPVITGPSSGTLLLWGNVFGLRSMDANRDSLLIFAENDLGTRTDDYWVHANAAGAVTAGTGCPGGQASISVPVANAYPPNGLAAVRSGAPVRNFELAQVLTYADVAGDWWLGVRRFGKATGWSAILPVLGPLAPGGLQFAYFDADGNVTAVPAEVARIGVTVIGRTDAPVSFGSGRNVYVVDTLRTEIALRNNRR